MIFRHMEKNPWFNVMTINIIPCDRPKIVIRYRVKSLVAVRLSLKIIIMLFVSCRVIPYWGGFSENLTSSRQLDCSICDPEDENFTIFGKRTSCALSLRAWIPDESKSSSSSMSANTISPFQIPPANSACPRNIPGTTVLPNWWSLDWSFAVLGVEHSSKIYYWCVHLFQFFDIRNQNISFPKFPPAIHAYPRNIPGKTLLPKLMMPGLVSCRNRKIFNHCPTMNCWTLKMVSRIAFHVEFFPSARRSWTFRR